LNYLQGIVYDNRYNIAHGQIERVK